MVSPPKSPGKLGLGVFHKRCRERGKCRYCEKAFKNINNLKEHILTKHEKKRDFHCDKCEAVGSEISIFGTSHALLWQPQSFCARQKDDLHSVKLVFVPLQKFLKRH